MKKAKDEAKEKKPKKKLDAHEGHLKESTFQASDDVFALVDQNMV